MEKQEILSLYFFLKTKELVQLIWLFLKIRYSVYWFGTPLVFLISIFHLLMAKMSTGSDCTSCDSQAGLGVCWHLGGSCGNSKFRRVRQDHMCMILGWMQIIIFYGLLLSLFSCITFPQFLVQTYRTRLCETILSKIYERLPFFCGRLYWSWADYRWHRMHMNWLANNVVDIDVYPDNPEISQVGWSDFAF